jgi:hypothetical protein
LQNTRFDDADISGALLWETQRAGWSINGVICENAFWDEKGQSPTIYTPGEFEKLHSSETCIELRYPGGLSTFELSTLPALIYHLSQQHGSATISLKSVEQTGGGAKVTLSLGDADTVLRDKLETDATQLLMLQLKAREDETLRLHDTLRQMHETTIRLMLAAGAPQTHFHGPVHTAALASGNARVEVHQTFNDSSELVKLIDRLLTGNTGLTPAQAAEVEGAKAELEKGEPQRSRLNRFYEFLKSLPKEAVLKGVGKLGEKATETDWASLLRQMGEFIHHVH